MTYLNQELFLDLLQPTMSQPVLIMTSLLIAFFAVQRIAFFAIRLIAFLAVPLIAFFAVPLEVVKILFHIACIFLGRIVTNLTDVRSFCGSVVRVSKVIFLLFCAKLFFRASLAATMFVLFEL